ncbi:MAG: NADP-dependent 3-hydroxy acid dehydrogenase YdfG, partial [Limisphaerales bacterium]
MKSFKNKVVVITGAGSGIGRALALVLSKRGAKLALNDFDRESLDETKSMLQGNVLTEAFDVSDKEKMYAFATRIKTELGSAHAIINNAGIEGSTKPAFLTEPKEYERTMQVNFNGVLYGTLAFLPQLVENNEGAVINISSIFGLIGVPNNADYCASKFAVRGFTETLMAEFEESPINIHCVHPGGI